MKPEGSTQRDLLRDVGLTSFWSRLCKIDSLFFSAAVQENTNRNLFVFMRLASTSRLGIKSMILVVLAKAFIARGRHVLDHAAGQFSSRPIPTSINAQVEWLCDTLSILLLYRTIEI